MIGTAGHSAPSFPSRSEDVAQASRGPQANIHTTMITGNLHPTNGPKPPAQTRLTGALLDGLTHHVNILEMNGDSHRLGPGRARKGEAVS